MLHLSELLDLGHVVLDVEAGDVAELLTQLSAILVREDHLSQSCGETLRERLLGRERLGGTCLGGGVAVPHGYGVDLPHPILLLARLKKTIVFGEGKDAKDVDLVFLMTGPESAQKTHVKVLARLMRLLHDARFAADLRAAADAQAVLASVRAVEERHV